MQSLGRKYMGQLCHNSSPRDDIGTGHPFGLGDNLHWDRHTAMSRNGRNAMEVSLKIPRIVAAATALGTLLLALPSLSAHHSVASEVDGKNCRDFTGILTRLAWENPHTHFFLDIKDASGN